MHLPLGNISHEVDPQEHIIHMKKTLTLTIALATFFNAPAQCELTIPFLATPIHMVADTMLGESEGYYWVCDGVTAHINGDNSIILGEAGSFLHIFGDNNTVISKDEVMIHGMNTNMYALDEEMVDDQGTNTNLVICSEIIFHLDTAPPNGCMSLSLPEISVSSISIHPNPVADEIMITFHGVAQPATLNIMDLQGRPWITDRISGDSRMDLSQLPAGIYTLVLDTPTGRVVRKIRKTG
jgi:hypothetical protein